LEGDVPSLGQFSKFLIDRADVLEALNRNRSDNNNSKPPMPPMRSAPNNNNNYANQRQADEQNAAIVNYSNEQACYENYDPVGEQNATLVNYSNQQTYSNYDPVCEQNATIVDYSNQQTYNGNDDLVDGQNTTIVNYSNQNSSSQVLLSTAMIEVSNPFSQQKVPPLELETILQMHPGVKEASVVGQPIPVLGELPTAFIVRQPGFNVSEKELVDYIVEEVSLNKRFQLGLQTL
ncbi:Luciferase-like protein, partial [Operophtera brumata]